MNLTLIFVFFNFIFNFFTILNFVFDKFCFVKMTETAPLKSFLCKCRNLNIWIFTWISQITSIQSGIPLGLIVKYIFEFCHAIFFNQAFYIFNLNLTPVATKCFIMSFKGFFCIRPFTVFAIWNLVSTFLISKMNISGRKLYIFGEKLNIFGFEHLESVIFAC